jgi:DNA polymerase-3 subunit delta'
MFDKLTGNNRIKEILRRLLTHGRVPNSLIFSGIEGVGKKQFAIELARSLLCRSPVNREACDECSACRRVEAIEFPKPDDKDSHKRVIPSEHPDFGIVLPYNRNILIDAIRSLETEAQFRPYEDAARIFVIDDADKMNPYASNALLKTLEEPPATSYIFLITSRADSLLPTIRSRCQILRFEPVNAQEIETYLSHTNKFLPEDIPLVARIAHGSIGRAIRTDAEQLRSVRELMLEVIENGFVVGDTAELLRIAESVNDTKNKNDFEYFMDVLKALLHDVWLIRMKGGREGIVNSDIIDRLEGVANAATARDLAGSIEAIENLQGNLIVNINRKIATDALFVELAA